MRRKLYIGCLLFAWLCANGALWNVVQVVAWVKMFAELSTHTSAFVFVQLPVYQRVNGLQLEPKWLLSVGLRWRL